MIGFAHVLNMAPAPRHHLPLAVIISVAALILGCTRHPRDRTVVVYTALDQVFSEQIIARFEQQSGIRVKAVYDTEATKTVGLVNRLLAEKDHPRCDVFWNNEIVRTVMLKHKGVLQPYRSPSAQDIPDTVKDAEGYWTGFAARARVLICNTNLVKADDMPRSIFELTRPEWRARVSLAYPLFGTTATQAAALFAYRGQDAATAYFDALKSNAVLIVDGNATAKDTVARGEVSVGFTDTDDAHVALRQGKPVRIVFPDQDADQIGTLVIPNTVALIRNSPNPDAGRQLIDFLLSREVEELLATSGSAQMPVRAGIPVPAGNPSLDDIKAMAVDWETVEAGLAESAAFLEDLFVR